MAVGGAGEERVDVDGVGVVGQGGEVEEVSWRRGDGGGIGWWVRVFLGFFCVRKGV